jgi:hypothetical protein
VDKVAQVAAEREFELKKKKEQYHENGKNGPCLQITKPSIENTL